MSAVSKTPPHDMRRRGTQIANFLFGDGFAVAEGELWQKRRRAVAPSLHKDYLEKMVSPSRPVHARRLSRFFPSWRVW